MLTNTTEIKKKKCHTLPMYIQIFAAVVYELENAYTHSCRWSKRLTFRSDYENGRQLMVSYLCKVLTIHKILPLIQEIFFSPFPFCSQPSILIHLLILLRRILSFARFSLSLFLSLIRIKFTFSLSLTVALSQWLCSVRSVTQSFYV